QVFGVHDDWTVFYLRGHQLEDVRSKLRHVTQIDLEHYQKWRLQNKSVFSDAADGFGRMALFQVK
ncbi:hypothetical protein INR49_006945, partial [Caranx melampygus]